MAALIVTALLLGLGLLGPADSFRARAQRAAFRIVGVAAVACAFAAVQNHHDHPCGPTGVGAGGMCVTAQIGATA